MNSKKRTLRRLGIAGVATATATIGLPALASAATLSPHAATNTVRAANLVAPSAPSGLKATDAGANTITLSWTAPTGTVSGYNIYKGTSAGGENLSAPVNGNVLVSGTSTTVTVGSTGTYYFVVTAVNAAGQSGVSNEASAAAAPIANNAPSGLTAVASAGAVSLNWTAPTTGDQPSSYQVYEGTTSGSEPTLVANPTATSAYVDGLNDGTTYYFIVKAVNSAGTSPASSQVSATPNTGLVPPAPVASATAQSGSITVSWAEPHGSTTTSAQTASNNNVTGYNVYEGSTSGGESSTPINGSIPISGTTSVTVPATNGTAEYFTVKAVNSAGMSASSNEVTATPEPSAAPGAATLSGTAGYKAVTLKWTPPASSGNAKISGYKVYEYDETTGGTAATATSVSSTSTTSATVSTSSATDTYGFFVVATNANGEIGTDSNTVSLTPDQTSAPSAPTALTVTTTPNGSTPANTLSWTASTNAGSANTVSYDVYEGTPSGTHTYLGSTSGTTYTDPTGGNAALTPNTSYSYYVEAATVLGVSGASNVATITTGDATPGAPTGLTAGSVTTNGTVPLSWNAPADQGIGNLTYTVLVNGAPASNSGATVVYSGTSATVSGLTPTTQYSFTVEANTASTAGGAVVATSGQSNSVSVTPTAPSAPGAPTGLKASPASDTSVALSWTAPTSGTVTGYDVYETSPTAQQVGANVSGTSFTVTGLTQGTAYTFDVKAVDDTAASTASNTATATPGPTVPGAPTGLSVRNNGNLVDLMWKAPTNNGGASITGYNIYESGTALGSAISPINGSTPVTGTMAEISGLTAGTPVDLYVKAVNSVGSSGYSSPVLSTPTTASTPGSPGTPEATAEGAGKALVVWTPPSNTGGSPIVGYFVTAHLIGGKGKTVHVTGTSATVSGLSAGRYYFTVVAINAIGGGTPSGPSSFVSIQAPSTSSGVKVYVTPPKMLAKAGVTVIRVTTNRPGVEVHLFDEAFGTSHFFQKKIMTTTAQANGTGVAIFRIGIARTNKFFVVAGGKKSNTVIARVK